MLWSIEDLKGKKVGEIVSSDIRTADVFKDFGIDYCCRGERLLGEVCKVKGIELKSIMRSLEEAMRDTKGPVHDYQNWSVSFLIDFINNTHHPYVRSSLPILLQYGEKVFNAHGSAHEETFEVLQILQYFEDELLKHLKLEEEVDFIILKKLIQDNSSSSKALVTQSKKILQNLQDDHVAVGDKMLRLERITNNFIPPADACNTFKVFYKKLSEFRDDLFNHIHLENNILFQKISNYIQSNY